MPDHGVSLFEQCLESPTLLEEYCPGASQRDPESRGDLCICVATLRSLGEPSIARQEPGGPQEAYRFICMPSRRSFIAVRIESHDSAYSLHSTTAERLGLFRYGSPERHTRVLAAVEWSDTAALLDEFGFWSAAQTSDHSGLDGASWYLEGFHSGTHRILSRWSPRDDDAFRAPCQYILGLAALGSVADGVR